MIDIFGFQCGTCVAGSCSNFSWNLMATYYESWLSKVEILKDEKGYLIDIFDTINLHRMSRGVSPVLLTYGHGLTIVNFTEINYDKNFQPISAKVVVNLDVKKVSSSTNPANPLNGMLGLSNGTQLTAIDWKLFRKENKEALKAQLKVLGYEDKKIIDNDALEYLEIEDSMFHKCIFFRNNLTDTPSLEHLNKILYNIHDLDIIADRNRLLINSIYTAKTGKKLTVEQASNLSITLTKDGYGIIIVEADGSETELSSGIHKEILTQSINNWQNINAERVAWEESFHKYGALTSEKISSQRENIAESLMRTSRVNSAEKTYYKWVKKFLDEYQAYFGTKLEYQFDTLISNVITSSSQQLALNTTSDENKLVVDNSDELKGVNSDE